MGIYETPRIGDMVKVYIAILAVSLVLRAGAEIVGKSWVFGETEILKRNNFIDIVGQTRYHCYRFSSGKKIKN